MFGKTKKDEDETPLVKGERANSVGEGIPDEGMQDIYAMWLRGEEELKSVYPDFDFSEAMTNDAFKGAVLKGYSLPMAYIIAERKAKTGRRNDRISENGAMQATSSGSSGADPSKLPKKEFDEYIKRIKNS